MSTAPRFDIDLADFWADPYPALAAMRADAPIAHVPQLGATLMTKRADITLCEKNVAVFSSHQPGGLMNVLMGHNMMRKDGEAHHGRAPRHLPRRVAAHRARHWRERFAAHAGAHSGRARAAQIRRPVHRFRPARSRPRR